MVDQERQNPYGHAENRCDCIRLFFAHQKNEISNVKKSIVKQKEPGRLHLRSPCRLNGLVIDAETFCRELFQIQYAAPVEDPDNDALAPVDPHEILDVPLLHDGQENGDQIGKYQQQGGSVRTEMIACIHLSVPGAVAVCVWRFFQFVQWRHSCR